MDIEVGGQRNHDANVLPAFELEEEEKENLVYGLNAHIIGGEVMGVFNDELERKRGTL